MERSGSELELNGIDLLGEVKKRKGLAMRRKEINRDEMEWTCQEKTIIETEQQGSQKKGKGVDLKGVELQ